MFGLNSIDGLTVNISRDGITMDNRVGQRNIILRILG